MRKPVFFVGPRAWVATAQELVPVSNVRGMRVRGIRDAVVPPIAGKVLLEVADTTHTIVLASMPQDIWTMHPDEYRSIQAESRGIVASNPYADSLGSW